MDTDNSAVMAREKGKGGLGGGGQGGGNGDIYKSVNNKIFLKREISQESRFPYILTLN